MGGGDSHRPVPAAILRLFPGESVEELTRPAQREVLLGRLLEDGDSADLAWLVRERGEKALRLWLVRRGGRRLSRRSRAFWRRVLGVEPERPAADAAAGDALWPL